MSQKQYRLLARAQIDGAVREPGYVFTLKDGERGPYKTIVQTNTGGPAWRHFSEPELLPTEARRFYEEKNDTMRDVPLFEAVRD
jgi:hypothetical protein